MYTVKLFYTINIKLYRKIYKDYYFLINNKSLK